MDTNGAVAPCEVASLSDAEVAALIAASQPNPVPSEYEALIVNVISSCRDYRAANVFQKVWQLNAGAVGAQREDWREERPAAADSAHILNEAYFTGDTQLADLQDLLSALAKAPFSAVVLGRLLDTKRTDGARQGWFIDKRSQDFYADAPTRLLPVDVDNLDCEPLDAADAIDDFISKFLPELEGCAYVWHHTGSSGIKGARVRLWFLLAEARHLAAMRAYAQLVNDRAGRVVIDGSVYTPSHLIFTADPQIRDANGNPTRRPVPSGVWLVNGDLVSADAFADVAPGSPEAVSGASARAPQERLPKKAESELLASLGPGNYATPIHAWICSQAWRSPEHRREFDFTTAVSSIRRRIIETSEPAERDRRLREHGNERELRLQWDAALVRLKRQRTVDFMASAQVANALLPSLGNLRVNTAGAGTLEGLTTDELRALADDAAQPDAPLSVDETRERMKADFERAVDAVLLHREAGHYLFAQPPGVGKSRRLEYLTRPGFLCSNRMRLVFPTHRLAAEQLVRLRHAAVRWPGILPAHGDVTALFRHHKGRDQPGMCIDDESRPKADRAAQLGVSVKKTVCSKCKSRDTCPWIAQSEDVEPGIIIEAHAAAVVECSARPADLVVVDESIVATLIESGEVAISTLENAGKVRSALGGVSLAPLELRNARAALVASLRAAMPAEADKPAKLPVAGWESFALDTAVRNERELQANIARRVIDHEDSGKDAKAMREHIVASKHAVALYEAIVASVKHQRQDVGGVAVFAGKRDAPGPWVRYAVRSADAERIFSNASITLDGTADVGVWRAAISPAGTAFDGAVHGASVAVPDGVRIYQYVDKSGSRSSLLPDLRPTADEKRRKTTRDGLAGAQHWARNALGADEYDAALDTAEKAVASDDAERARRALRGDANIILIARKAAYLAAENAARPAIINGTPITVLLVAQKAVAEKLRDLVPAGVAVEHFGVLRGLNAYEHVPVAVIVGRMRPSNIDLELMTEALHSHNPKVPAIARYDVALSQGRPWCEQHPDALVAALQSQITTAEVRQAMARARIYNRAPDNPVDVHVFGQCDLGLPAERVRMQLWSDAQRSPVEIAAARGCVFADMRLNQRAHPGLFPKGAKDGWGRADREGKAKFADLVANLARHESRLKPYIEIGEGNPGSLLALETGFERDRQPGRADALDFSMDGTDAKPGRGHKLVKVRVAGAGKACLAIVAADWTEAAVAQLVGAPVDKWLEQTGDQLQALAARCIIGAPDVR